MIIGMLLGVLVVLRGNCLLSWLMGVELMVLLFLIIVGYFWRGIIEGCYLFFIGLIISVVMVSVVLSVYVQGLRVERGCHIVG